MAKYVSLENLELYDEKIKGYIGDADAALLADAQADAKGKADAVQAKLDEEVTRAKSREDEIAGLVATAQGEVDALEGKVGNVPEGSTVMGLITEIQENAYDDSEVRGLISGLDANKADKTQVATDIANAAQAEATARAEAIATVQGEVDALEGAHAADKAELEGKIALKADQTTVDGVSQTLNAVKEDVDAFFKDADMTASAKDTLKELQEYIASDETGAAAMAASIQENAGDIDALDGKMTTVEGKVSTLEGEMDAVEAAVATKAEAQALASAVAALEGADTGLGNRIATLEGKFGGAEGSVEDMVADAKAEAIATADANADAKDAIVLADAKKYADDEDAKIESRVDALETASATHALASDVQAIDGRVTVLEGKVATNEGAIAGLQTDVAGKASQTDLNAAVVRITTNETNITALQNAVNDIKPVDNADIDALFA